MGTATFGLRDFLVHQFPGSVSLIAILFLIFDPEKIVSADWKALAALLLIGGFSLGFASDMLREWLSGVNKFGKKRESLSFRRWIQDPLARPIDDLEAKALPTHLKKILKECIKRRFGYNFNTGEDASKLVWFMLREIEYKSERLSNNCSRILAYELLARNFIIPTILSAICLFIYGHCIYAVLFLLIAPLALARADASRAWLFRTVARSFIVINSEPSSERQ